jgi:ABC-type nickel/cobalt efflux system permease component RcnA
VRRWTRPLAVVAAAASIGLWPSAPAEAHPLGNFTINVYGGVIVQPDAIVVDYIVDMAEIPAFRERRSIDRNLDGRVDEGESGAYREAMCASLADGLAVRVGGTRLTPEPTDADALSFPPGAGGLSTLRLGCRLRAASERVVGEITIGYTDRNFPDALGWREVTAVGDGMTLVDADVPQASASARLTAYPQDELPLDVRRAELTAEPGGPRRGSLPAPGAIAGPTDEARGRDGGLLESLVGREEITPALVAAMIAIAVGVGAVHALGPGHGKTLIGAYLVGAGGSIRHAVGVGAAVSVMHTASVLTLGLLVLMVERVVAPERVYPVLGVASGVIALVLGSSLLVSRIHAATHERDGRRHPHARPHDHARDAANASPLSRRGLLALAFSGGMLPSPSALVVLLASVSLGRTVLGLTLIAAFSVGLAIALIGVGILSLRAGDLLLRRPTSFVARSLPFASAAAITAMGVFLTARSATQL